MRRFVAIVILSASWQAGCSSEPPLVVDVGPDTEIDEGKADGEAPKVELKVTIDAVAIDDARDSFALAEDDAEKRHIHFYDTLTLDLFEAGIVLRARKIEGRDDDSTAKIRPLDPATVAAEWFALEDFKCETDRLPDRSVDSCSLSDRQAPGEIDIVARGQRAIGTLFDDDQERFLATYGAIAVELEALTALGTVTALVWKIETMRLDAKLTAELWTLPDGRELLELSTKVKAADADGALADLLDLLADEDLPVGDTQETKTRVALQALVDQAAQN